MICLLRRMMTMLVLGMSLAGSVQASDWSLQFNGTNQYATFGAATATLGTSNFTLECWFKRTGTGVTTTTGSGGITAVPLVTKGRGEADASNKDCNYFLGITTNGVLGADFEEGAGQTSPGLNHPVTGTTVITNDRWYHAAVTFDGTTWKLYLDGALDGTLNLGVNRGPRSDSIQHAAVASALTSAGAAAGFFQGRIDEVRIWNVARSQAEILTSLRAKLPSATGLLGRWSLDEGTGTTIASSAGPAVSGTLTNTPVWSIDSPFAVVAAGSVWKYLDNGSDQSTAWRATGFNDTAWAGGPAELGYGDGGEATVVAYGSDANNKYVTTYFRHTFQVTNAASYSGLDLSLVRDDGAIVYLNGTEIWRSNMPTGEVLYNMYAASPEVSGTDESKWFNMNLPSVQFNEGTNVVAVEIHQQRAASSDISFNLKVAASRTDNANPPPVVSLTAPSAATILPAGTPVTLTADATDNSSVAKVEFFANGVKLGETAASPFSYDWIPAAAAQVTLTAKATDNEGASTTSAGVKVTVYEAGTGALQFDGVNDHVTFGSATNLGAASFTLECWMRKLGTGVTSTSGNGGIVAVPLITKGRGEQENSNVDCNYFFGILPGGALAADFEQFYADGAAAGQNYPVTGTSTAAGDGGWHHAAVTYDGANWVLYVDGIADRTLNIGNHTPRFDSIQHAGIGTAMNSAGVTEGAFAGILDEVRIWNYARTAQQISDNRSNSITVATGLLGRWSLNDGSGTSATNSVAGQPDGTLVNGPLWCAGLNLPAAGNTPPVVSLTAPANGAHFDTGATIELSATSFDDGTVAGVEFFRDGVSLGSDAASPYSATWSGVPAGDYALTAVATDNTGLAATSAVVNISVTTPNLPPVLSALSPANGATGVASSTNLSVTVSDPEAGTMTVSFYGRLKTAVTPGADFTVVALPDTQFYSQTYPNIFQAQTDWIVANRTNLNIVYVAHLGDIVNDGDSVPAEWPGATNALYRLENPVTTGLPDGIPYGVMPGNHDHVGGTVQYNTWFGTNHFAGRSYYGGHYGSDNQNHYDLISASGMDFIFLFQDFNYTSLDYVPLDAWADSVLKANADRRAIVISHDILAVGGAWDSRGQTIYENLKDNPNLFLMLCGHNHGEGNRQDTFEGRTVYSCLSDYQSYANGGNGYLRLYQFSPASNVIHVKTYSPYVGLYETDANSQFDIPYTMSGAGSSEPFTLLGVSSNVPSGTTVSLPWSGLLLGTNYEWYAVASDGANSATGTVATFFTGAVPEPAVSVSNPYASVDWATYGTFKGNLHAHSTNSDGNQAVPAAIDGFAAQGYDFLAMTDHNFVTYPWSTYGRDPATLGMVDIQGNELSSGHHIVSLFSGYASTSADAGILLAGVAGAGGISFFAHPGRYSYNAQWYADYYTAQPSCIGMEIYNQGDRYTGDRVKWDEVLSILMPSRPVWGFSNDDSHDASHIGKNRTCLLSPSASQANVRTALEDGAFYATYSTSSTHVPPAITNVVVNAAVGTITVQGTGYTQVRWISQGTQVATGETLDLVGTPGIAKYVRAELHGAEGIAYSNPFGLLPTGTPTNQAPTVSAGSNQSVSLAAGATLNGSASDDGLPNPPGTLTLLWEQIGGQGTATFANAAAAQTTVSFSAAGTYVLRLTASDGTLTASAEVTITVQAPAAGNWTAYNDCSPGSGQLTTNITTFGIASPTSGTLVDYATGNPVGVTLQIVNNPSAPANVNGTGGPMPNAGTDAYETFNGKVSFANVIWYGNTGWYVDAVVTGLDPNRRYEFATSVNRGNTSYTTRWSKFTLSSVDAATQASTTGVQVNSETSVSFWAGYNNVNGHVARWTEIRPGSDGSFTVRAEADGQNGHSTQQAYAFDGILLRDLGPATPGNQAPTVSAGNDQTVTLPATASLSASASDDNLPNPPATLTLAWTKVSGPGTVVFADAAVAQTTATFAEAGAYVLRLTADDGVLQTADDVTVTVTAPTIAGISFHPTGTDTQTFDSRPPATEWATGSVGLDKYTYANAGQVGAAVQGLDASAIAGTLVSDTVALPARNGSAVWSSYGGGFIQTCPTSIGATLLKATLVNQSSNDLSALRLVYQYTVATLVTEEIPGQRVFYSLTGAAGSWMAIPELSGVTVSTNFDVTVTLTSLWTNGATLFLLWADDNDTANSPDTYFQIDNFAASPAAIYTLTAEAGANGTVMPATAQVTHGGSTNFTITAASYYHIADVRTNGVSIGGSFGMSTLVYTWNGVAADGTLAADFVQNLTPGGTPEAWLAGHNLADNEENTDKDGDGMTARAEYVAGTDPTNLESVLKITGAGVSGGSEFGLKWPSVEGRVYDVESSTNLSDTVPFQPLLSGIPSTPSTNSCSVPVSPGGPHFFRVKVRLAP